MSQIKTLIELFDSVQIENVVAGLRFKPKKIVFIGFKEIMTKKKISDLNDFFSDREENIEVEYEIVGRYDYDDIVQRLNFILDNNEDCYFDLTGGKELVIAAMGAVSSQRNVPVFQINVRNGNLIRVRNCEMLEDPGKSFLTLEESVKVNGCTITHIEADDYDWDLNGEFKRDIETIWEICRKNCGLWNRQSNVFENFEKFGTIDESLSVAVNLQHMNNVRQDTFLSRRIIQSLINNKLIFDYENDENILKFRYKNNQIRLCLTKAGNILELYVYMLLQEISAENPEYYDDLDIGVYIDWDGIIHSEDDDQKDTKNEIDIMVMRDLVPVFISCKNGEVHKEALYELSVVAQKCGGRYAKKLLMATYVSSDANSRRCIEQRAKDMGIEILDGLNTMSKEKLKDLLKKRIK